MINRCPGCGDPLPCHCLELAGSLATPKPKEWTEHGEPTKFVAGSERRIEVADEDRGL